MKRWEKLNQGMIRPLPLEHQLVIIYTETLLHSIERGGMTGDLAGAINKLDIFRMYKNAAKWLLKEVPTDTKGAV